MAKAGVPAVVAVQHNITIPTSQAFMGTFFNELQRDGQIDRAMAVARGCVRERPDWWMPVLYMRLKDGKLWEGRDGVVEGRLPEWDAALDCYRQAITNRCETNRIFSWAPAFSVGNFFTEVQLHEVPRSHLPTPHIPSPEPVDGLNFLLHDPKGQRLIILGQPGTGKSTLLKRAAWQLTTNKDASIPVLIELRLWDQVGQPPLPKYIEELLTNNGFAQELAQQLVPLWLKDGRIHLFLDGLDEIPPGDPRKCAIDTLYDFGINTQYEKCRLVITYRIGAVSATFPGAFTYCINR